MLEKNSVIMYLWDTQKEGGSNKNVTQSSEKKFLLI
jgi:hypothetical protein